MHSLYWFRTDLRIADNEALAEAMRSSDAVIAVFILTPDTWKAHDAAPCKIQFILDNLRVLSDSLWERGIPLLIRSGPAFSDCPRVLQTLCDEHNVNALYFNREYPLDERKRDEQVEKLLSPNVAIHTFDESCVLPPGAVTSKNKKPLQVFTPFKNEWLVQAHEQQAWCLSKSSRKKFQSKIKPDSVPESVKGFEQQLINVTYKAGEKAAQKKLMAFCEQKINAYKQQRDFPGIEGTSQLSPYLAQGVISPRQCISVALHTANLDNIDRLPGFEGPATWVSELIWREFYQSIVYFYPQVCMHKPFRPKTDNIPWRYDEALLQAWKEGTTGFPIVDAGMRQLAQTGWMHNRLRMIVAMFLSKLLLLDWRLGEKHFMQHLIDGDFASNNGGWQWSASTGTDSVPYFRIFNPTMQSERFDPNGDFIRQYCPELAKLDNKTIHAPFAKSKNQVNVDYPKPIVDYKAMRQRTLELFKSL